MIWSQEAAERPIAFIERFCRHHKGEWAGRLLTLEDWEREGILAPIFGWLRPDGTRRYRRAWIEVPRKQGKTELAAGIGVYLLIGDGEPGAEVYATATKQDQARILWDAAAAMVRASPDLRRFVREHTSRGGTLFCDRMGSKMQPLGSDSKTLDGLNPHGDLRDEVHQWTDHDLAAVLDTALGARRQPLTVEITTAGVYDPTGVGWQHHEYATQVLEGVFEDDRQFVYITAADDTDDPFVPETWKKANPNLGVSVKLDYIAEQAKEARQNPTKQNDFLRLHLNRWTQQAVRWLSVERWDDCDKLQEQGPREKALEGRECFAGLDLSTRRDLAACVLAFRSESEDVIDLVCRFWLPEDAAADHAKRGRRHFEQWSDEGWIKLTPGNVIDYDVIHADIAALGNRFLIREIAFDPWNATQIATQLQGDGFSLVEMRQGFPTLSEPSKEFEARILGRKVRHGGNPVLRWMVANANTRTDPAGNIKPVKPSQDSPLKIDGVIAAIMAIGRLTVTASPLADLDIVTLG